MYFTSIAYLNLSYSHMYLGATVLDGAVVDTGLGMQRQR